MPGIPERERRIFNLGEEWSDRPVFKSRKGGCSECRQSGYSGRTAILEIIPITPKISDELSKGVLTPYELEVRIQEEGKLPNLRKSGLKALGEGKTDLAALSKVIDMTYTDE